VVVCRVDGLVDWGIEGSGRSGRDDLVRGWGWGGPDLRRLWRRKGVGRFALDWIRGGGMFGW